MYTTLKKNRSTVFFTETLQNAGIRATRQRLALSALLFDGPQKHFTAEQLYQKIRQSSTNISLATIYNSLHQFTQAGLLNEISVDATRAYFDTNTNHHHHFYNEDTGLLTDIPEKSIKIANLPKPPAKQKISRVEIVLRLSNNNKK